MPKSVKPVVRSSDEFLGESAVFDYTDMSGHPTGKQVLVGPEHFDEFIQPWQNAPEIIEVIVNYNFITFDITMPEIEPEYQLAIEQYLAGQYFNSADDFRGDDVSAICCRVRLHVFPFGIYIEDDIEYEIDSRVF